MDDENFNRSTNTRKRVKRIDECCQLSKHRESQAVDLLLSRLECQFLFQLLHLLTKEFRLFTFSFCMEALDTGFIKESNVYIQGQLKKEVVYDKSCSRVIPEKNQVWIFSCFHSSRISGVLCMNLYRR